MRNIRIYFGREEAEEALKVLSNKRLVDDMRKNEIVTAYADNDWITDYDQRYAFDFIHKIYDMLYWSGPRGKFGWELTKGYLEDFYEYISEEERKRINELLKGIEKKKIPLSNMFLPGYIYLVYKFNNYEEWHKFLQRYESRSKTPRNLKESDQMLAFFTRKVLLHLANNYATILGSSINGSVDEKTKACYDYIKNNLQSIEKMGEDDGNEELGRLVINIRRFVVKQKCILRKYNRIGKKLTTFTYLHSLSSEDGDPICAMQNFESQAKLLEVDNLLTRLENLIDWDETFLEDAERQGIYDSGNDGNKIDESIMSLLDEEEDDGKEDNVGDMEKVKAILDRYDKNKSEMNNGEAID